MIHFGKIMEKRFSNPLSDAETFRINKNQQITEIGNKTLKLKIFKDNIWD